MARSTSTTTSSKSGSVTDSRTQSQSQSQSQSLTSKVLDDALRDRILAGLMGYMTDEEISAYAENLLKPQLHAGLEAADQEYETIELAKQQEIENAIAALTRGIEEQEGAHAKSRAALETAAQARGMGRSSYLLSTLSNADSTLAKVIENLTTDSQRQQSQIQQQITQAAKQKEQTKSRLNTDYAAQLAAKTQELKQQQRQEYNQNYLTAVSGAMGSQTIGSQQTQGSSDTHSQTEGWSKSTSVTSSGSSGSGKKTTTFGQKG